MNALAVRSHDVIDMQEPGCAAYGHEVELVLVGAGADGTEQFASECLHCGEIVALHF